MPTALPDAFGTINVTLTNANEAYEMVVPSRAAKVSVYFETNAGFIAWQGTEGVAMTAADQAKVDADAWVEVTIKSGSLFLESATAGTKVYIVTEAA